MIRYSVAVLRPVMIFIRSSVFRFVQNWSLRSWKADSKYNVDKDSWSGGYWRDDLKNEVSVNTLMLNAYYDFRNDSAFTPWVSAGLATPEFTRKQPVSVHGL